MATPRTVRHALLIVLTAALASFVLAPASARAEPRKSAAEVQREIDALTLRLDNAVEDYNQARIALTTASRRAAAVQTRLVRERAAVDEQRRAMAGVAIAAYRGGGGGGDQLMQLVGASDPGAFLERAMHLDQVTRQQADALQAMQVARHRLAEAQAAAHAAQSDQAKVASRLQAQKADIEAALAKQKQLLNSLQADERPQLTAAPTISRPRHIPRGSGGAAAAVNFAYAQLGKPYQWGAAGPNSYDCSGLTMASWNAGGVSLPHSSRAQYGAAAQVSRGSLQPGDLVFYGSPIHHVALYIGGGKIIHAMKTGTPVQIDPIDFEDDYVGSARP